MLAAVAGLMAWTVGDRAAAGIGGPFALVGTDDRPVTDRATRGRYMLIYFGYTACPDVCPTTLTEMTEALDLLGPKGARVQPVFLSVDPGRDTPPVLRDYVAAFGPRLVGLTGSEAAVASVLREYHVTREMRPQRGGYVVDHSAVLYLMGPDGRFVAAVRADAPADRMAAAIAAHLS